MFRQLISLINMFVCKETHTNIQKYVRTGSQYTIVCIVGATKA